jgi:DNA-directed RNA polymerase specialized sigma subunit
MEAAHTRLHSVRSPVLSFAPGSGHVFASDQARIVETLDAISVMDERYNSAVDYMNWFVPAWNALSEAERVILSEFYQSENVSRNVLISNLSCELFIERSQIYRLRDKALERLSVLLYGL